MTKQLNVNPTRGNLLRLKDALAALRTRHRLLDRKREILVQQLMERLEQADKQEAESRHRFQAAHAAIQTARMRMGSDRIRWICLSPTAHTETRIETRTIMGVKTAGLKLQVKPIVPPYGISDTSASLDEAREKWMDVLRFLGTISTVFLSIWPLARALRRTRRQVNALETTLIPRYRRTIRAIEAHLEEEAREEIVTVKKLMET